MRISVNNEEFLDNLFLPEEIAVVPLMKGLPYTPNSIIWRNVLLYAGQGAGKSELVRTLAEIASDRYGHNRINCVKVPARRLGMAFRLLDDKPIQLIFIDDFTLIKPRLEDLHNFFEIRHFWNRKSGRNNGYIITIEAVHRFHAMPKEFRNVFDFLLVRSSPDSVYDRNFLEEYFGSSNLDLLKRIEMGKLKDRELFNYTLWRDKTEQEGFLKLGMAKKNRLNEVVILPDGRVRLKRWWNGQARRDT